MARRPAAAATRRPRHDFTSARRRRRSPTATSTHSASKITNSSGWNTSSYCGTGRAFVFGSLQPGERARHVVDAEALRLREEDLAARPPRELDQRLLTEARGDVFAVRVLDVAGHLPVLVVFGDELAGARPDADGEDLHAQLRRFVRRFQRLAVVVLAVGEQQHRLPARRVRRAGPCRAGRRAGRARRGWRGRWRCRPRACPTGRGPARTASSPRSRSSADMTASRPRTRSRRRDRWPASRAARPARASIVRGATGKRRSRASTARNRARPPGPARAAWRGAIDPGTGGGRARPPSAPAPRPSAPRAPACASSTPRRSCDRTSAASPRRASRRRRTPKESPYAITAAGTDSNSQSACGLTKRMVRASGKNG